jgi:hypothetical protein
VLPRGRSVSGSNHERLSRTTTLAANEHAMQLTTLATMNAITITINDVRLAQSCVQSLSHNHVCMRQCISIRDHTDGTCSSKGRFWVRCLRHTSVRRRAQKAALGAYPAPSPNLLATLLPSSERALPSWSHMRCLHHGLRLVLEGGISEAGSLMLCDWPVVRRKCRRPADPKALVSGALGILVCSFCFSF